MTYCVGIKAQDGIVFASDSRTNAGLDNVNIYSKMFVHDVGDRSIIIVTSGNLGTSQAVYKSIEKDLKNITSKEESILGLKFDTPSIMGALNITPDSFSDGGLFFEETKAYDQAKLMINSGATIIDIGGESTRPGSKTIDEKDEWQRVKNTIIKLKKNFPKKIV
mgnify:CR=1 FL=1